jgi:hypothetical protein
MIADGFRKQDKTWNDENNNIGDLLSLSIPQEYMMGKKRRAWFLSFLSRIKARVGSWSDKNETMHQTHWTV